MARFLIRLLLILSLFAWGSPAVFAKVVVFWQDGFPVVASQPISRAALNQALQGMDPQFAGIEGLRDPSTLANVDLLVLPYGSAFPAEDWSSIESYLHRGGNLLTLGGQPFRVPVTRRDGSFSQERPQDSYPRELGLQHTYEVPVAPNAKFAWKEGYDFLKGGAIQGQRFFALEGRLDGLGYMVAPDGTKLAAPVVVIDRFSSMPADHSSAARIVMLDFEPKPGYWESPDGVGLVDQVARYALQGAAHFWIETLFSTVQADEPPSIEVRLENGRPETGRTPEPSEIRIKIASGTNVIYDTQIKCSGATVDIDLPFHSVLAPGFYRIRGVYASGGQPREFYQNGFWVEDGNLLKSGPVLGVKGDFLTRDGKPFFPFGTNYFTTEENGWDFSGPRNAAVWEDDFADMERHGVTFVRTGVWMANAKFIEPSTGGVNQHFLRNLEAYLLCARSHNIIVDFTFFAFSPRSGSPPMNQDGATRPLPNPYTDPAAIHAEESYVLSVVNRFKDVGWLCWDLINEPSFSNPREIFQGNIPNGDPTEVAAWQKWLGEKYGTLDALASAWSVTPEQLKSFDAVPLPAEADLKEERYGNPQQVRAVDYNLFAQDAFTAWVHAMVTVIHGAGSRQLINVGEDEGGVTNRLLNQFYVGAGVSFTVNHTYWQDDALLWDSIAARHPGTPNIIGETGYQPVWAPDGAWRYDELTGFALLERKLAFGFAAGTSGALQWDWAREVDFGMERSDGSAKSWEAMMRDMGSFARAAAPWATGLLEPQVAVILPQSLQLSVRNAVALQAQQTAIRALYHYARAEAYAVGEYQIDHLGSPKLIILPSPYTLTSQAWTAIADKVRAGATLFVSGPFDEDPHFHSTGRQETVGLPYADVPLTARNSEEDWPSGKLSLIYSGNKTTILDRAQLPDGRQWREIRLGNGKILFSALPLELNDNLQAVGDVYRYALQTADVAPTYVTDLSDPGILICPTMFPHATLYVLTSESNRQEVSFTDRRSGKHFSGELAPGRAALLLIGEDGKELAVYNWNTR